MDVTAHVGTGQRIGSQPSGLIVLVTLGQGSSVVLVLLVRGGRTVTLVMTPCDVEVGVGVAVLRMRVVQWRNVGETSSARTRLERPRRTESVSFIMTTAFRPGRFCVSKLNRVGSAAVQKYLVVQGSSVDPCEVEMTGRSGCDSRYPVRLVISYSPSGTGTRYILYPLPGSRPPSSICFSIRIPVAISGIDGWRRRPFPGNPAASGPFPTL